MDPKLIALREKAAAAFKAAGDYLKTKGVDGADTLDEKDAAEFDGLMKAAREADEEYEKAARNAGNAETLRSRLDFYHGKATDGGRLGWKEVGTFEPNVSLGEAFVNSDTYKALVKSGAIGHDDSRMPFRTDPVTVDTKATTTIISSGTGRPADLVVPQYLPGILPLAQRELVLRDLFAQGRMTSDILSYAQQATFERATDMAVGQATTSNTNTLAGGLKPQSSITWVPKTSNAVTIATWMATTRQALADVGQLSSLIDNQGRLMIELAEEDEILDGNGAPGLTGILRTVGVQTLDLTGADNLDGVRTAIRLVKTGISRGRADGIVLNPFDSEEFDLLKDEDGQYRGGNPIGNFNFGQTIWRLPRVESDALPEGVALVGAFKMGASVLERSPITVYTTDSHSDFFIRNLVVILFEERIGMPVFFPSAFVKVTLADWDDTPSGSAGTIT